MASKLKIVDESSPDPVPVAGRKTVCGPDLSHIVAQKLSRWMMDKISESERAGGPLESPPAVLWKGKRNGVYGWGFDEVVGGGR